MATTYWLALNALYADVTLNMHPADAAAMYVERNKALMSWMENNNIGGFPMRSQDFASVAHLFDFLSVQNSLLTLLFTKVEGATGKERDCLVLRGGRWLTFKSRADAVIAHLAV